MVQWLGPKEEGGTEPGSPPDLSVLARVESCVCGQCASDLPSHYDVAKRADKQLQMALLGCPATLDPRGEIWAFSATNLHQNLSSV